MNIDLPAAASEFIDGLVASGEFQSAEEAVAAGIQLLISRQQLRADIERGIDELDRGEGLDGKQVFAELRERAKTQLEQAG